MGELCSLVEMNTRKIRYYIQKGLLPRPEGTGRGAYYTRRHVELLLTIRKWKEAGLTLERIKELVDDEQQGSAPSARPVPPPRPKVSGSIEVWSHIHIADGLELHIEPGRSGLSPEQIRSLGNKIMEHYQSIRDKED